MISQRSKTIFSQVLAPLLVWAELSGGSVDIGEQKRINDNDKKRDRSNQNHPSRERNRHWPRNTARNLNTHPRDLRSSPARNLGPISGGSQRESEASFLRRNTSAPFIRQSLPSGRTYSLCSQFIRTTWLRSRPLSSHLMGVS